MLLLHKAEDPFPKQLYIRTLILIHNFKKQGYVIN